MLLRTLRIVVFCGCGAQYRSAQIRYIAADRSAVIVACVYRIKIVAVSVNLVFSPGAEADRLISVIRDADLSYARSLFCVSICVSRFWLSYEKISFTSFLIE